MSAEMRVPPDSGLRAHVERHDQLSLFMTALKCSRRRVISGRVICQLLPCHHHYHYHYHYYNCHIMFGDSVEGVWNFVTLAFNDRRLMPILSVVAVEQRR